jgi:hypothetical protein
MELQWALANTGRRFPLIQAGDVCQSLHGVYLVYHDGNPERPLLIGHGNIREHLRVISRDPDLIICSVLGMLRATWAAFRHAMSRGCRSSYSINLIRSSGRACVAPPLSPSTCPKRRRRESSSPRACGSVLT